MSKQRKRPGNTGALKPHLKEGQRTAYQECETLMLEYGKKSIPACLIDYRMDRHGAPVESHVYCALRKCAFPFLTAYYDCHQWVFRVRPENDCGLSLLRRFDLMPDSMIQEKDFVKFLFRIRGIEGVTNPAVNTQKYSRDRNEDASHDLAPIRTRHHCWPKPLRVTDLDHLLIDCNSNEIIAIFELKNIEYFNSRSKSQQAALEEFTKKINKPVYYFCHNYCGEFRELFELIKGKLEKADILSVLKPLDMHANTSEE